MSAAAATSTAAADRRVWLLIVGLALAAALCVPLAQGVFGVRFDYTLRTVTLGGALLGALSGMLGCFAVLRRESLMGDALSHAALPGVGVAFLVAGRELGWLLVGAGIASWLGVQFISALTSTTRLKQDVAMGIVLAAWFAAGLALLTIIQTLPDARQAGLSTFIFGQAAAIVERDVRLITVVGAALLGAVVLLWKEFALITFDPGFAAANGLRAPLVNVLLSTLIVIAIVLGLQLAGVILMVGLLIAPAIAARQWTHTLGQMVLLAGVFGAFAGGAGAVVSALDRTIATGPAIIVLAAAVVALSLAFAPGRGLAWRGLHTMRQRRAFAAANVLEDAYRYAMAHDGPRTLVPHAFLRGLRPLTARSGLARLQRAGLIAQQPGGVMLTAQGVQQASDPDAHTAQEATEAAPWTR